MNIYKSLPTLKGMMAQPGRRALGALGERLAMVLLEQTGRYEISSAHQGEKRGDLRVIDLETGEIIRVEVKTARQGKRTSAKKVKVEYGFTLKTKSTDYQNADYVILLPVLKTGDVVPFVIPVEQLGNRKRVSISGLPQDYSGKWARFRQKTNALRLS